MRVDVSDPERTSFEANSLSKTTLKLPSNSMVFLFSDSWFVASVVCGPEETRSAGASQIISSTILMHCGSFNISLWSNPEKRGKEQSVG